MGRFKKYLILLVFFGLVLRLIYITYGFYIKGGSIFGNGDSFSYSWSIINFLEKGIYSFDLKNPDAAFGRLPGYPIFWGIHYIIFKSYAYIAVAITQALLDSLVVVFIFKIINKFSRNLRLSLLCSVIYTLYVFSIVWVPVTGTESIAIFFTMFYLFIALKEKFQDMWWYALLGILCAAAFYVREYLGILFPISASYFLFLLLKRKIRFKNLAIYAFTFISLYSLWPLRNYIVYDRIEFLKPASSGYNLFEKDFSSFREWMYTWHTDVQPYFERIKQKQDPEFPNEIFKNADEHRFINALIDTSLSCGSSFYAWRFQNLEAHDCNDYISKQFDSLTKVFIARNPIQYYIRLPLLNLNKAFFKSDVSPLRDNQTDKTFLRLLFFLRTFLLILGFAGLLLIYRSFAGFIITCFSVFMYIFVCVFVRQVEMRYLLQADVTLLIPAMIFMERIFKNLNIEYIKK